MNHDDNGWGIEGAGIFSWSGLAAALWIAAFIAAVIFF